MNAPTSKAAEPEPESDVARLIRLHKLTAQILELLAPLDDEDRQQIVEWLQE